MTRRLRGDDGQTAAEMLGLVVIVGLIIGAVAGADLGGSIASAVSQKVCDIARSCEADSTGAGEVTATDAGGEAGPYPDGGGYTSPAAAAEPEDGADEESSGAVDGDEVASSLGQIDAERLAEILEEFQVDAVGWTFFEPLPGWIPDFLPGGDIDPVRVTETEADVLDSLRTWELQDFKDIRDDALGRADELYAGQGVTDGHGDAFRHAYWNARLVQEFGLDFARDFATAHEQNPGNRPDAEAMDLHNNEVGRQIAVANPDASSDELVRLIDEALGAGDLVVIDADGELAFSDDVPRGETGRADDLPTEPESDQIDGQQGAYDGEDY